MAPYSLPEAANEIVEKKLRSLPEGSLVISQLVRAEFASLLSRRFRTKEMDEPNPPRSMAALDRHSAVFCVPLHRSVGPGHLSAVGGLS